ncbi:hypothetical protein HanRHA438_Chr15g0708521 [Helianthus annuus]|uniref:Uncharacterized protein n=1 Tax=Helianthus annuus TaxID=4232 RepID=A0A9K3E135_HELAN|nr:hypothetical protein HanXRQr2_Chr15g0696131 [Helianthus annuus]KAJ0451432.1 hypothetical protein HanHA300_Chr15g0567411 [Helianthus annuus]KAJ0455938.1 hypothetical protein HanIR_Chr15g0756721 [Helianthus annuus]KAJ0473307.1 hypothetical protein HanHA89_Chr15g0616781 [Helianthus annuus]KAJ0648890.1 hypothetical protein HanLR1_Chr15g0577921 [Helianthus annuus]
MISIPEIKLPEHVINIKASHSEVYPVDSSRSSDSEIEEEEIETKTTEGGGGEVVERYKSAVTAMAMVDDDPCRVEVVICGRKSPELCHSDLYPYDQPLDKRYQEHLQAPSS